MRNVIILLIIFLVGILTAFFSLKRAEVSAFYADYETQLLDLHNEYRAKYNLPQLTLDQGLSDFARKHADAMAHSNLLFHSRLNTGHFYTFENIAVTGSENPLVVFDAWKKSRDHRASILAKELRLFGAAMAVNGKRRYWVVVLTSKK